jgi:hypothetical protein
MPAITYAPTHLRVQVRWGEPGAPFALSLVGGMVKQQASPLRYPGFPVELGGVGELHAAFHTESRTRGRW